MRLATGNPGYRPPPSLAKKGSAGLKSNRSDRTSSLQTQLLGLTRASVNQPGGVRQTLKTGNMPVHFDGRGHLEGTCIAKEEGLLETKQQRRKRCRKMGKDGEEEDDMFEDEDEDSEEEEEERKVWKPVADAAASGAAASGMGVGSTSSIKSSNSSALGGGLDGDIASLNKEGLDWGKNSKYGKKSNANFQKWLDSVAKSMHEQQVVTEDTLFTCF